MISSKPKSKSDCEQSGTFQIRVRGRLDDQWSDWFENLTIMPDEDGTTLLTGPVVDDAALHGLLKRVRDSGMRLLSVNRIEGSQEDAVDREQPGSSSSG